MAPNQKPRRGASRDRINMQSPLEVRIWAMSMGVSEQSLKRAVERTGDKAETVREFLHGKSE